MSVNEPIGITETLNVYLLPRNGGAPLRNIPFTSVDWERVSDQTSTCSTVAAAVNGDVHSQCCAALQGVEPWAYEIGVYRNKKRCWAGPITSLDFAPEGVTIQAGDLSAWLGRRWIHNDYTWKNKPLSRMVQDIVYDAMYVDDEPGLVVYGPKLATTGTRTVKAKEYRIALTEIDDISRSGLDWAVVDRIMNVSDFESAAPQPLAYLHDGHFTNRPSVAVDGNFGTRWAVLGGGGGSDGPLVVGLAKHTPETLYGVHERTVNDPQVTTQKQANQSVEQYRGLLGEPNTVFAGGALAPSAPITVFQLVPGAIFKLALTQTCRAVEGFYRLRKVTGRHDGSSDSISIECEPIGSVQVEEAQG